MTRAQLLADLDRLHLTSRSQQLRMSLVAHGMEDGPPPPQAARLRTLFEDLCRAIGELRAELITVNEEG